MKKLVVASETIEAMSKLRYKYADRSLFDENFGDFIYFSPVLDSHGPRIKFYGGSKETSTTRNAPSLAFDLDGNTTVILQNWMTKKNCPNAFDNKFLDTLTKAVNSIRPILLLVGFLKLDEADALHYFEGSCSWIDLLNEIQVENNIKDKLVECNSMKQLDDLCKKYKLYSF